MDSIFFLLFTIAEIVLTFGEFSPYENSNILHEVQYVVGGSEAQDGMFPWTVALFYKNSFVCTASLISQRAVLTAGHCVVFNGVVESPEDYYGIVGSASKSGGTRINFSKITPHPKYDNLLNDVAVLTTQDDVQLNDVIQPICLAEKSCTTLKPVIAMGWGITTRDTEVTDTPDKLQYTNLRVYPNSKCSVLYFNKVPKTIMCAGALRTGICSGDSGGPLVMKLDEKKYKQVGVASFMNTIFGCGRLLGPAGFTKVSSYKEFIEESAEGDVCFI